MTAIDCTFQNTQWHNESFKQTNETIKCLYLNIHNTQTRDKISEIIETFPLGLSTYSRDFHNETDDLTA